MSFALLICSAACRTLCCLLYKISQQVFELGLWSLVTRHFEAEE